MSRIPEGVAARWLQAILEECEALVYVKDREARHLFVNRKLEEHLGLPREQVLGKTNAELVRTVADSESDPDRGIMDRGAVDVREDVVTRGGEDRLFLSKKVPLHDDDGNVVAMFGMSTDVTATRHAEAHLRRQQELTRLLVESSTDGILAFDTECRYTVWNKQMERLSGVPAENVIGRRMDGVFPFLVETGEDRRFYDALAGRVSDSFDQRFTIPETGREGWFEGRYAPVHDANGRVVGGLAVIRDVTQQRKANDERLRAARLDAARAEAEAAAKRFAFLADVGAALSSSLDYEQTLQQVARLAIPVLGDLCVVDVIDAPEGGGRRELRRLATAHVVPEKAALFEELRRKYPPQEPDSRSPAARVLRSIQPDLLPVVTPEVIAAHTNDAGHSDLILRIGIRSHIAVPLVARGNIVGVISLGITESDRRYDDSDVALAMELARRAALAVDNARLHAELRLSEERFRAVIDQSPLSTQVLAADGYIARVNKAWERLWGVTAEMIPDYNLLADPQLEARGIAPQLRRAFAGEAVEIGAHRYDPNETLGDLSVNADPVRWIRTFAYPVKDAAGAVREVALVQEDVSARVRAEEQVRASEERLRLALQGARMAVWDWNLTTGKVEWFENAQELWGVDAVRESDFYALVHPDDVAAVTSAVEQATVSLEPFVAEHRIVSGDGEVRWVQSRGRAERDASGQATRIRGVTVDVTERRAAEEATRLLANAGEALGRSLDAEATLHELARVVVPRLADWCAIDLVDEGGALHRVAVYHPDPSRVAVASDLLARFPPKRNAERGAYHVMRTGQAEHVESITDDMLRASAMDEEHLSLVRSLGLRSYIAVPLVARGSTIGVLTLVHAESHRRYSSGDVALAMDLGRRAAAAVDNGRLYQRVRDEDRRKDDFLATLAHELRNPLAPLRTGLELLRVAPPGPAHERTRTIMERQLGHMVRLVDDLLEVARVTRGKIDLVTEPLDVGALMSVALELSGPVLRDAGVELVLRAPEPTLSVNGDRTRLAQVLSNLLNNAAKYTPRGGSVTFEGVREGDEAMFRVVDTGIGIPPHLLGHVFEMFVQVRGDGPQASRVHGGLGIGLTLARRLVELHGGRVWAESEGLGRGSTFTVGLPALPSPADAPPRSSVHEAASEQPSDRRRVLVVDDNEDGVNLLASLFELEGHDVKTAVDGPSALQIARAFRPEVAFLDIGLPGMNGYELARHLRSEQGTEALLLVAVTGWGQADDRRQSRDAGFDHHLTKPVDVADVRALLRGARP